MESNQPDTKVKYFSRDFDYEEHRQQQKENIANILANNEVVVQDVDSDNEQEENKGEQVIQEQSSMEELQKGSQKSWDKFYLHNQDKFFKNRNYLSFAFELIDKKLIDSEVTKLKVRLFEVGCGTGNTIIPLKEKYQDNIELYACDFSPNAVQLLDKLQICEKAFVKDMVTEEIKEISPQNIDFITMIFFLSAIHPAEHELVIKKLALTLKVGGSILFRDYGAYDLAMIRFINKKKGILDVDQMVFKRGDNTLACFFESEKLTPLMEKCGLKCIKTEYCTVQSKNFKRDLVMRRVFVNAIYQKEREII